MFKGFQKPKRLVANTETLTERFGQFTAQPFERGFGSTIGTGLRRVLLSSIEGAAITGVRIDGVSHEFSPIPGVVEDATDIILNLKQVPFKMIGEGTRIARLHVESPGEVMSSQIETDADVEVLDRNLHIATVGEGGKLNIEMRIKSGRGYVSADRNYDEDLPLGYIPIDSVHSPVRKANYTVEAARLGQNTDYDKLTLEVWTNGAISPQDAVGQASKLLKDHMTIFINFEETPEVVEQPEERAINQMNEVLNRSVEELELSVRSYNCLKNANIQTIGDLVQKSESEMLRTKNFGRKSLNEIKEILSGLGLSFGMKFDQQGRLIGSASTTLEQRNNMRHRKAGVKLKRDISARRALLRGLVTNVIEEERITTTVPKAKAAKPLVEKMITLAKEDNLHTRRQAEAYLMKPEAVDKLFEKLGPRFNQRNGGYTRIIRLGWRKGDGAETAKLELVGSELVKRAADRAQRREERLKALREGSAGEEGS
jgi:DNA-directed RNA polymerase subunit alpha